MSKLTFYEKTQIEQIAAWKAELPSHAGQVFNRLRVPLRKVAGTMVHETKLPSLLTRLAKHLNTEHDAREIARRAGVAGIKDLYHKPLEVCDRLADRVSVKAEREAMIRGTASGLGGLPTELAALPLTLQASLHSVVRIGHCYGFSLKSPEDMLYILGIMELSTIDDPERRQALRQRLYELVETRSKRLRQDRPDAGFDAMAEDLMENLVEDVIWEAIPIFGDFASFAINSMESHRLDIAARRVFQERRLRAQGKVKRIPPAAEAHRHSVQRDAYYLGREMIYVGSYGSAFVLTLPAVAIGDAGALILPRPIRIGLRDGGRDGYVAASLAREQLRARHSA
ncbi:hypothetical protein F6R98_08270 [Candidatus Methylospira mobilis]|uniref:EcsC family protein n=1 Tax=Candidatus Methylospira mobilis TaxID=1808979 RepID=A0A5Q0BFG3_9GAMM|nr:EcsC family protein [Candidatus Methylospira mobilis]QFY42615.1 hypothetical protein F6R98_08270 [Candidatus Methylospira mobilis]WNV04268.1 EcsC family protein [Candidatus Methylospira mobilis]